MCMKNTFLENVKLISMIFTFRKGLVCDEYSWCKRKKKGFSTKWEGHGEWYTAAECFAAEFGRENLETWISYNFRNAIFVQLIFIFHYKTPRCRYSVETRIFRKRFRGATCGCTPWAAAAGAWSSCHRLYDYNKNL